MALTATDIACFRDEMFEYLINKVDWVPVIIVSMQDDRHAAIRQHRFSQTRIVPTHRLRRAE